MSDTQINVGMNVDAVVTGTDKAKRKISELGGSARDAGNEAAKGMASIGNGGEAASRKVEAATKNTINSIQRQIAAFEAGDKSSRKYQESLARMRGIDVAALKPYLDQLDQVKLKQNAATTSQESMTVGFSSMKIAAYAAAALGALGVAFKNIVNGVDALNDLKDATGASIENISALEDVALRTGTSFDTVGATLIKFNGVLKDNKAGTATAEAFKAIGVSVDELKALDPAEALRKVAVAFSGFADDGNKARIMQELFGKSTRDVAALMKDLAEKGQLVATVTTEQADEAGKLNKEFAAMSKNVTDLARDIAGPLVSAFNEFIKKQREAKENGKFGLFTSPIQAELDYNSNKRTGSWSEPGNAGRGNVNPESVKPELAGLPDTASIKAAASASAKALAEQNKELEKQSSLLLELSGYNKSYTEDVQRLVAMRKEGALTEAAYSQAVTDLIAKQPVMVAQAKAQADAQKELNKALDEFASANSKALASASDEVAKAQASYDAHGKLASVLQEEALARLENWRIITAMGGEDTGVLDAQIAAKKELIQILRNGEVRDASEQAAKDMMADQKKAAEESGKFWEDALMRAFESGKGFFESLWDTIKNTLKTQVLKVTVQGVMGTLGIGASGAAMASGGGTDIFGLANTASSLTNLYSAGSSIISIGGQVAAGTMSIANALGTMAANATGTGISGLLAANGAYGTAAAGTAASAAGGLTAGLAAIPGWGWAALGVAAVASIFGGGGETRSGATYDNVGGVARYQQGPSGGEIAGAEARRLFNVATDSITAALAAVGSKAKLTGFTAGLESSGNGKGFDFAGGFIDGVGFGEYSGREGDKNGQFGLKSQSAEQAFANYTTQLKQATVQALQAASDVPKTIKDMLSGIDANTLTGEAVDALLANINVVVGTVNNLREAVKTLPFEQLKTLSFDAAAGLIAFSGGMEALGANLGTYYSNFYTAEEQRAQTIKNINAATAGSGLDAATATKESFRALVEAQDLATESGQKTYAALMAVSGAFAGLTPVLDGVTNALSTSLEKIVKSIADMRSRAESATAGVLDSQTAIADAYTASQDKVAGAQETLNALLLQSADNLRAFGGTISDFLGQLVQDSAKTQSLSSLKAALSTTAVLAQGGDESAQGKLLSQARAVLDRAQYTSTSAADYARNESFVKTLLGGVQTSISTQLQDAPVAATLDQQIATATQNLADAQAEQLRYAQLAADTGTNIVTSTDRVGDEITLLREAYDAAVLEQTAANLQLGVALAALDTLGLSESALTAIVAGNTTGTAAQNDFAVALGVTSENIASLQTALGLNDETMSGLADSLNAVVGNAIFATLSDALKVPAPVFADLATELNVSAIQMGLLAGALGTPIGLSTVAEGYLITGLVLSSTATETIDGGLSLTEASAQLLSGVPLTQAAVDALVAGIAINPNTDVTTLAGGLTLAKDSTAAEIAKGLVLQYGSSADKLAAGITLSDEADLLASGLVLAPDAVALAEGLTLKLGVTETLGKALGLNDESLAAILALQKTIGENDIYANAVTAAYGSVGRSGFEQDGIFDASKIDVGGYQFWIDKLKTGAVQMADFQNAFLQAVVAYDGTNAAAYTAAKSTALGYLQSGIDLPQYAVGTNYVPNDGPAYLHAGEAVIPAAYNPAAGGQAGNSNNAELINEIKALKQAVQALQKAADSSAASNKQTADTLKVVTRGGRAIQTEAFA